MPQSNPPRRRGPNLYADPSYGEPAAYVPPEAAAAATRGVLNALRGSVGGIYNALTQPRQTVNALAEFGRNLYANPRGVAGQMVRNELARIQAATQSPEGFGEYAGSFIDPLRVVGMARRGAPVVREMTTYHATPHTFEPHPENPLGKFDHSRMGTGEGAQAYGWGTYLTSSPSVREFYASSLSRPSFMGREVKDFGALGEMLDDGLIDDAAWERLRDIAAAGSPASYRGHMEKLLKSNSPREQSIARENLAWMDQNASNFRDGVNRYTVDLPDKHIASMIDWDGPVSALPADVRSRVSMVAEQHGINLSDAATGADVYQLLEDKILNRQYGDALDEAPARVIKQAKAEAGQRASSVLRNAGIPGIKYRAADQTDNHLNFVVFDEDLMQITGRE